MDLYNREIVSYSISLSPNLVQIREMLNGLFEKLPKDATPLFHSDQGWQYQHAEYQRLLAEHNIINDSVTIREPLQKCSSHVAV